MRLIFMGTPDFAAATLEALAETDHEIVLVVTQPDRVKGRGGRVQKSDVKLCAEKHGFEVFQPEKVKSAEAVAHLLGYEPELIVVAAFGQILSKEILDLPKYGCINVHASLLPHLRGASPIQTAIMLGDKVTGVTIQQMNEGIDTGDILAVEETAIEDSDTGGSLFDRLAEIGAKLAVRTVDAIEKGEVNPVKQDDSKATYARLMDKSLGHIDWNKDASETERLIRALNPWPSAYTYIDGKMLKIWKAEAVENASNTPGRVISVGKDHIEVSCGNGALKITELQTEGKKRMSAHDFLLGYKLQTGIILG